MTKSHGSHDMLTNLPIEPPAPESIPEGPFACKTMARFSEENIERVLPRDEPWLKDEVKAQKLRCGE
jgi:hypothetical protein